MAFCVGCRGPPVKRGDNGNAAESRIEILGPNGASNRGDDPPGRMPRPDLRLAQDKFLFEPDPADPLVFKRADGTVIRPQAMFTDCGTVLQVLRAIKAYSPRGYAAAFLVHDWMFVVKHSRLASHEKQTLQEAVNVMAEAIKTLMQKPNFGGVNKLVHYSMYQGVLSSTAQEYWDNGGCNKPETIIERVPSAARTRSLSEPKAAGAAPSPTFSIEVPGGKPAAGPARQPPPSRSNSKIETIEKHRHANRTSLRLPSQACGDIVAGQTVPARIFAPAGFH